MSHKQKYCWNIYNFYKYQSFIIVIFYNVTRGDQYDYCLKTRRWGSISSLIYSILGVSIQTFYFFVLGDCLNRGVGNQCGSNKSIPVLIPQGSQHCRASEQEEG